MVRRAVNWLKTPTNLFSVVAFAISIATFSMTEYRRRIDAPFQIMSTEYDRYYDMTRMQIDKPHLSHLYELAEHYAKIKQAVHDATKSRPEKALEHLLQERAAAGYLFTYYEQTRARWYYTQDHDRWIVEDFLKFLRQLLRNPRLVYLWLENGGGLELSYDIRARDDWKKNVLPSLDKSKPDWCDPIGPFVIPANVDSSLDIGKCE